MAKNAKDGDLFPTGDGPEPRTKPGKPPAQKKAKKVAAKKKAKKAGGKKGAPEGSPENPKKAVVVYKKSLLQPPQTVGNVGLLLRANQTALANDMPPWSPVTMAQVISTAMEVCAENKALLNCVAKTILVAVKTAADFALSFKKVLGQAYLIPRRIQGTMTATLQIGYRGWLEMVRRAADVEMVDCDCVYTGEVFVVTKGDLPKLEHKMDLSLRLDHDKDICAAYAVAYYKDSARPHFEVMTRKDIDDIRARSMSPDKGPWVTDYPAMARKSAIRRLVKYLPLSAERAEVLAKAMEYDNRTEGLAALALPSPDDVTPEERTAGFLEELTAADGEKPSDDA